MDLFSIKFVYLLLFLDGLIAFSMVHPPIASDSLAPEPPKFETVYFQQISDHFRFGEDVATFEQRCLVNDIYFEDNSPVFFYTGNEGNIEMFWNNSGFVHHIAKQFGALVVFCEHRYYGQSLPFKPDEHGKMDMSLLSTEQALADFASLITTWRPTTWNHPPAVIAFGGSYGGMLSAWLRVKYPWVVDGSLAASAPVGGFLSVTSPYLYPEIITKDYDAAGEGYCVDAVKQAFALLLEKFGDEKGREMLTKTFKLCSTLEASQTDTLLALVENGLSFLAMLDYPYPTDFLRPLPANPVNVACSVMHPHVESDLVLGLAQMMGVYENSTGKVSCYNLSESQDPSGRLGWTSWDYQACTEMVLPEGTNGVTDFFPPAPFSLVEFTKYCQTKWKVTPRADWGPLMFGAFNLSGASNIVFSNGDLDPWSSGGVKKTISDTVIAVVIKGGAHHLDMRWPNEADPQSVIDARDLEIKHIQRWIDEASGLTSDYDFQGDSMIHS